MVKHEGEGPRDMKKAVVAGLLAMLFMALPSFARAEPVSDWVQTDRVEFHGTDGFFRSQGLASDGASLVFSWNLGLIRTPADDPSNVLVDRSTSAIPEDLADSGHNHIGDIDMADGIIYAPIEDGHVFAEPWIVLYDAQTLEPTGQRYLLPVSVQRDGVPWVAVDWPRGVAYSMEWNDTGKLFVYRLSDFQLINTVTLSQPVPRIQGAEVFRGYLYASRDNGTEKSVVAIDPVTGQVTHLFDRNLGNDYEAEGITFVRQKTGTRMELTGIREGGDGYTDMVTYRIGGDQTAPKLSAVSLKPARMRPGSKLTVSLEVSEASTLMAGWLRCTGPKRKPCSKTREAGLPRSYEIQAGMNSLKLAPNYPRLTGAPIRLGPGVWQLALTPTDRADIVGKRVVRTMTVLKPGR